nr:C2H2-type zinc finger protein [Haladaptatus sp. DYSN1]
MDTAESTHTCEACGREFETEADLEAHINAVGLAE